MLFLLNPCLHSFQDLKLVRFNLRICSIAELIILEVLGNDACIQIGHLSIRMLRSELTCILDLIEVLKLLL